MKIGAVLLSGALAAVASCRATEAPDRSIAARPGERATSARTSAHHDDPSTLPHAQKITTFLWFDGDAEEAIEHYVSIFDDSEILDVTRCGDGGPWPEGTLLTATFRLAGQEFMALNGGPQYAFTEAISLFVRCETQAEIDELWEKLSAGGEPGRCGWLKDRYGLSWQIVPDALGEMLRDEDPEKAKRVGQAMLGMGKLDIERLRRASEGL